MAVAGVLVATMLLLRGTCRAALSAVPSSTTTTTTIIKTSRSALITPAVPWRLKGTTARTPSSGRVRSTKEGQTPQRRRPPGSPTATTTSTTPPPSPPPLHQSFLKKVTIEKGKARLFKEGNPVVYGGSVGSVLGNPKDDEAVVVVDHNDNPIGWGVFNSASMYRVRLLAHHSERLSIAPGDIDHRIKEARLRRQACNLPNDQTTCFRLINGEGDRLSGLVVDCYGDLAVVASSARWVETHRDTILEALKATVGQEGIKEFIWRRSHSRLQQDGWKSPERGEGAEDEAEDGEEDAPSSGGKEAGERKAPSSIVGLECGLKYKIFPSSGQKTGFYCDQRQNRELVRSLSLPGKRVLDLFCYTGGFALNAAYGGATDVVGVDSSGFAVETAQENALLNGLAARVHFVREDAQKYMAQLMGEGAAGTYDLVILDPPKLAPTRQSLPKASKLYRKLNAAALKLVAPGGLLLTCTCSSAMTQSGTFTSLLSEAAGDAQRQVTLLQVSGPALDHLTTLDYPESKYLTAVLLAVT